METMDIDPSKTQQYIDLLARQIQVEGKFTALEQKIDNEMENVKEELVEMEKEQKENIEGIAKTVEQTQGTIEVLKGNIERVEKSEEHTKKRVDALEGNFCIFN